MKILRWLNPMVWWRRHQRHIDVLILGPVIKQKANGDAYSLLKVAQAQADALRIQNSALKENRDVLELRRIEVEKIKAEKWDGALPQSIYAGTPVPFFNVGDAKK